jgi:hypothetical protein
MFQVFHLYVEKVDMGCCICCNDYIAWCKPMFQVFQVFRRMFQVFHLEVAYVAMVIHACFKCFGCFRRMLQVFHLDVAKVDLDIAYAAISIHAGFKRMFQSVSSVFQTYVASVSSGCFRSR